MQKNTIKERWQVLPKYPKLLFSNLGKVKTVAGPVLKQRKMPSGYITVCIRGLNEFRESPRLVHRLICEAFNGSAPVGKNQVRHMNGIRDRNESSNLKWGNNTENQGDRKRHGTYLVCEKAPGAKLKNSQVVEIRSRRNESREFLSKEFGVTKSNICYILKNKTFKLIA